MYKKVKQQLYLFIYTLKLLWGFNKIKILEVIILAFISGFYPIVTLIVTQNIMNTIQKMEKPFSELFELMIYYGIIALLGIIVSGLNTYCTNRLCLKLEYHMKYMLIKKCGELSLEDLETTETYDKISRLENEISIKPYQALQAIIGFISVFITLLSACSILLSWKPWLFALVFVFTITILLLNIKIGNNEFIIKFRRSDSERRAWYYSYLLTHDFAFKEIKANNLQDFLLSKYKILCKKFILEDNKINRQKISLSVILAILEDIIAVIVMYLAIKEAYQGLLLIGTAMSFMNASTLIQSSTSTLSNHIYNIYNSNLYMQLLKEFMEIKGDIQKEQKIKLKIIEKIAFKNVKYDYTERKGVLKDINFEIKKGQSLAIVGKNGSGKTTLLKLLGALYRCKTGIIEYNGVNENEIDTVLLRSQISILFQDYLKYEGTVCENIVMNSKLETEHLNYVMEESNLNFLVEQGIYNINKNLGTWFENGVQLSGGQWQKIALARVFYKKSSVYIFDEPSAALDVESERCILKNILKLKKQSIVIYITHNINLAQNADKIMVLDNGRIVGMGTHYELYKRCITYRELLLKEHSKLV